MTAWQRYLDLYDLSAERKQAALRHRHAPLPVKPVPLSYRRQLAWLVSKLPLREGQVVGAVGKLPLSEGQVVGAEIGVAGGNLSYYLLNRIPQLTLHMVDPWRAAEPGDAYDCSGSGMAHRGQSWWDGLRMRAFALAERFPWRAFPFVGTSLEAAAALSPLQFDFVFLDGDHSPASIRADLAAWWTLLRPGGLLAGHDYRQRRFPAVKEAVDEFVNREGLPFFQGRTTLWATWKPIVQH